MQTWPLAKLGGMVWGVAARDVPGEAKKKFKKLQANNHFTTRIVANLAEMTQKQCKNN